MSGWKSQLSTLNSITARELLNTPLKMNLPENISEKPNVAWLKSIRALTSEELRQHENHSQFEEVAKSPLDLDASDEFGRELWSVIEEENSSVSSV